MAGVALRLCGALATQQRVGTLMTGAQRRHFNVCKAVDKKYHGHSLKVLASAPISAIEGVADRADDLLGQLNIHTVEDLANWRHYLVAKAVVQLARAEERGTADCAGNINGAVDKAYESKSLNEIAQAPVSALQGVAPWANDLLATFQIKSVHDLARWKHAHVAEAIVFLSRFENADKSSR